MAGRPTKLTPEVTEAICKTLRAGNFLDTAIAYAGLSRATVRRWFRRGRAELDRLAKNPRARLRKDEKPFVEFVEDVEQAMAHAETLHVTLITQAASKRWQAAAWLLERAHHERWGSKKSLEVKGEQQVNHSGTLGLRLEDIKAEASQELEEWRRTQPDAAIPAAPPNDNPQEV